MDLYKQLLAGTLETQIVPTGKVNGRLAIEEDENEFDSDEEEEIGTAYAKPHIARERAMFEDAAFRQGPSSMSGIESVAGLLDETNRVDVIERVYMDYNFVHTNRPYLPVDSKRIDILQTLEIANVLIIQGSTGCGKTTQVPQFILNDCQEKRVYCKIIVTQPRKLAAISVSTRVCEERGWPLGSICGYQVGLDKNISQDTILSYVTTGVLLQKIIQSKNLNEFTHIIIDEVHERTQEMDFLLIILRRFQVTNSSNVKIILMSATFDTHKFSSYFCNKTAGLNIPATRIEIPQQKEYQRTIHYLEELESLGPLPLDKDSSEIDIPVEVYNIFINLINSLKNIGKGHVLVFLPGIHEIQHVNALLVEQNKNGRGKYFVVPLHSTIPANEQRNVFKKPDKDMRKIILSTNIAESSITVPDVVFVIDFCMTKILVVDPITQYQSLRLTWASRTNCIQRAGRVGRVCDGRVYRLISREFYEDGLAAEIEPEMLRTPLERVILYTKKMDFMEMPEAILALAIDPPDLHNITTTIKNLKQVGALLTTCRGQNISSDGDLTALGHIMSLLPMDVKLSRLVCLGYIFSCLDDAIVMAAACSLSNIFLTPFQAGVKSYLNKLIWADGTCSDLLTYLYLYTIFDRNKRSGAFGNRMDEKNWCENNYLSHRAMTDWQRLITEIRGRLAEKNIAQERGPGFLQINPTEKQLILKVIIAGAFYPNYFTRSCDGGQVDEKEIYRSLRGLNPRHTIYFTNMDREQPGPLYEERIKQMVRPISNEVSVYFDNTSKVYVTFNDKREVFKEVMQNRNFVATMPGSISIDVYKSIYLRQLNQWQTHFPAMHPAKAWELAVQFGIATNKDGYNTLIKNQSSSFKRILPSLHENTMHIKITHIIDAGHFYAQSLNSNSTKLLETLSSIVNCAEVLQPVTVREIELGGLYVAKYPGDDNYYRCQVFGFNQNTLRVQVNYIDYGGGATLTPDMLFRVPPGEAQIIPSQAMECVLSEIQPAILMNPRGTWTDDAVNYFNSQIKKSEMIVKIYSVVDEVVSVELYKPYSNVSVNTLMVQKKFAEKHEESFASRDDHEMRLLSGNSPSSDEATLDVCGPTAPYKHVGAPKDNQCRVDIHLRGPYSPLEMKVFSLGHIQFDVRVDSTSVNSVLLDSDPQDPHERLLVASYALKGQRKNTLSLKHTTLMPNIHGLPALMALIFCPKMKIKASADGTEFASFLCGLGADNRGKAIYPDQDIRVILDVSITLNDLKMVNNIRYAMNKLVEVMQMYMDDVQVQPNNYHRHLKENLMELLETQRETKERDFVNHSESWHKSVFEGLKLNPKGDDGNFRNRENIWPLHDAIEIKAKDDGRLRIENNLQNLRDMAGRYVPMQATKCELCKLELITLDQLRVHLHSNIHQTNLTNFSS